MFAATSFKGWAEVRPGLAPRRRISHVVFDFDGTVSWLRHGWPDLMAQIFREQVPPLPDEAGEAFHQLLLREILQLNGKPSIHQIRRCADLARERGGEPGEPETLLLEYERRLDAAIRKRTRSILEGRASRDDFLVYGVRRMLESLQSRGLTLIILSGTLQTRVQQEAELLAVSAYFGPHIYGGTAGPGQFDKRFVLENLMRHERLSGEHLLAIGDGPVEIRIAKELGGQAVGLASNEERNGSGQPDPLKVTQLREAGADILVSDYRDAEALLGCLLSAPA